MQQMIHTLTGPVCAKISIPGSNKITYRALLLAALSDGVSEISGIHINQTTLTMIEILHQLGIATQLDEKTESCIIAGGHGRFPKQQATLWCDKSKINAYFFITACAISSGVYYIDGDIPLRKKNLHSLLDILCQHGAQITPSDNRKIPFTLIGADSLQGGEVIIHSKYHPLLISSLLMIAPFARSPFTFTFTDTLNQASVDLTSSMMADFGVLVHRIHQGQMMVPVPQRYHAKDYVVEPDFSLGAFFLASAAVTKGEMTIPLLKKEKTKQSNCKFLSLLSKMGCEIIESHTALTLKGPEHLQGIEVNLRDFSDTFYPLAAIASFANEPVKIIHIGTISSQDKKRMIAMKRELIKMGGHVEVGDNWIKISPATLHGAQIDTDNDPYLAMAFAIIGLKIPHVIIKNSEIVNKRYPDFFTVWNKLNDHANVNA